MQTALRLIRDPATAWSCSLVGLSICLSVFTNREQELPPDPVPLQQPTSTPQARTVEIPNVPWNQIDPSRIDAMQMIGIASHIPAGTPYDFAISSNDASVVFLIFYPHGKQPVVIQATNVRKTGIAVPAPVTIAMSQ